MPFDALVAVVRDLVLAGRFTDMAAVDHMPAPRPLG